MISLPPLYWYKELSKYAARLWPLVSTALAFTAWMYNLVWILIVGAYTKINALLASVDLANFGNADFSQWQYIGIVNAIFPLTESLALLSFYYTLWGLVIAIRWIKSFIPTVAN